MINIKKNHYLNYITLRHIYNTLILETRRILCQLENGTWFIFLNIYSRSNKRGCPCGVMVKAMGCGIIVSEFLLQSLLGKYPWERYEPTYPPNYGLNSTTTVLLGE